MSMLTPDQSVRDQALDPKQSFLIQAPAGSGKTSLLTQRLLVLLARAEKVPESVVAITFTRKAAAEMRERVLQALLFAKEKPEPTDQHAQKTWRLAKAVLARDAALDWHLTENPQRLRILTIDALCASITQRVPILSQLGGQPSVVEDARPLYQQAVALLFQDLDSHEAWQPALKRVLQHLDNRFDILEKLLIDMLAQRDQWLGVVQDARAHHRLKATLETAFANVGEQYLQRVLTHFPEDKVDVLKDLLTFSAKHIDMLNGFQSLGRRTSVESTEMDSVVPEDEATRVQHRQALKGAEHWKQVANLLLTQTGQFRRTVDKRTGFPDPAKASNPEEKALWKYNKAAMKDLLAELATVPNLQTILADIQVVPTPQFAIQQWEVLGALLELLPVLAAYLRVVFQETAQVDFTQIALSALQALGDVNEPSDVALRLDYQIQHLLVDEFQDTSQLQLQLLTQLTQGWQPDEGRTLFCVGDPMQSIYRFRQADVSLFLKVKQQGIGQIPLQFLCIEANFRSDRGIIDWVNQVFPHVMASEDDVLNGMIRYSPAIAMRDAAHAVKQPVQWCFDAQVVLQQIQQLRTQKPQPSIAILVRARSHLATMLPLLQQHQIPYQAVDIESLAERQVIQDLVSLTFALQQTADQLSWLAILRAPWAGLNLVDLTHIAQANVVGILPLLSQPEVQAKLSAEGRQIVQRIAPVLTQAVMNRDRMAIAQQVEQTWRALRGPDCIGIIQDVQNAETYFHLLRDISEQGRLPSREMLLQRLATLKAQISGVDESPIQVMTMHKAKGLEFDVVILPSLEKRRLPADQPLLMWEPYSLPNGQHDILMAPIRARDSDADPMYAFLYHREQQKQAYEMQRLLYVAVTRAKRQLILQADLDWDEKKAAVKPPSQSSLLGLLWQDAQHAAEACEINPSSAVIDKQPMMLSRLPIDISLHNFSVIPDESGIQSSQSEQLLNKTGKNTVTIPDFKPAVPAIVGTLIHRYLARMSVDIDSWTTTRISALKPTVHHILQQSGIGDAHCLEQSCNKVIKALQLTMTHEQGKWLLTNHPEARSEYVLQGMCYDQVKTSIVDRTFIDPETGVRWIIDYKTAEPEANESHAQFIAREQALYQSQLQRYQELFSVLEPDRDIKMALYFVMLPQLTIVEHSNQSQLVYNGQIHHQSDAT